MATSNAGTVEQYLAELPPDRRDAISAVRDVVRRNIPPGYEERMSWGMISYEIPFSRYPATYNRKPLCYAALASQKNHMALYLMCAYADSTQARLLHEGFEKTGKKLDMGKSCIRFRTIDDLPLDVIGAAVRSTPVDDYIAYYEATRPAKPATRGKPKAAKAAQRNRRTERGSARPKRTAGTSKATARKSRTAMKSGGRRAAPRAKSR